MARLLGVVVAGGMGRRLGTGGPKALARVGGITLLERARDLLAALCDEVVVTAPAGIDLPDRALVLDLPGASGPLSGVVAGLESRVHERALVLGVDFPLLRPAVLSFLLDRLEGQTAAIPTPGGVPQPLVAAYGHAAGRELAHRLRQGERSISAAIRSLGSCLLDDVELTRIEGGLENFFNLNTSADLERAESLLRDRAHAGRKS